MKKLPPYVSLDCPVLGNSGIHYKKEHSPLDDNENRIDEYRSWYWPMFYVVLGFIALLVACMAFGAYVLVGLMLARVVGRWIWPGVQVWMRECAGEVRGLMEEFWDLMEGL